MTNYTIKRTFGDQAFEVSGPEKEWVETQAEKLAGQLAVVKSEKGNPTKQTPLPAPSPAATNSKDASLSKSSLADKLDDNAIGALIDYVAERQQAFDRLTVNQAAIVAKFLKDNLGIDQIDKDDLAFVYAQAGWETVQHKAQLDNATGRSKYFVRKNGKFELNYNGGKFAQDTARNSEKA